MPALRTPITLTRSATSLIRGIMLEITAGRRPPARRTRTRRVPDLRQVPQLDTRIMPRGLKPVLTRIDRDRIDLDNQIRLPGHARAEPPGPVPAGRPVAAGGSEGEPGGIPARPAGRVRGIPFLPGTGALGVVLGFGPGAAVADRVAILVGHGQAPGRLGIRRRRAGQVPGQV